MTLHIISNPGNIDQCLNIAREQDVLLLTEECREVSGALSKALKDAQQTIYWLSDQMHGEEPSTGIAIDYTEFVALCEAHTPIQSWH